MVRSGIYWNALQPENKTRQYIGSSTSLFEPTFALIMKRRLADAHLSALMRLDERRSNKGRRSQTPERRTVRLRSKEDVRMNAQMRTQCAASDYIQRKRACQHEPYKICFLAMQGKYMPVIYDSCDCIEQSIETCGETWTEAIPFLGSAVAAMEYMLGGNHGRQATGEVAEVIMVILPISHHEMLYLVRQGIVTRIINGYFGSGWVWKYAKDFTTSHHRVHCYLTASADLEDTKTMDAEGFARIARTPGSRPDRTYRAISCTSMEAEALVCVV